MSHNPTVRPVAAADSITKLDEKKLDDTENLHLDRIETGDVKYDDKQGAINAELAEQSMTFKQAIREYPAAVFWSWAISLCIIMEGYDTALPVSPIMSGVPLDPTADLTRATLSECPLSESVSENM